MKSKVIAIVVVVVAIIAIGSMGMYLSSAVNVEPAIVENKTTVPVIVTPIVTKTYITPLSYDTLQSDLKEIAPMVVEVVSIPSTASQVVSYTDFIKLASGGVIQMVSVRKLVPVDTYAFFPINGPSNITEIYGHFTFTAKGYTHFLIDGKYIGGGYLSMQYNTSNINTWAYTLGEHIVSAQKISSDGKVVSEISKKIVFVKPPKEVIIIPNGILGLAYWHNGLKTFNYTDSITLYSPTANITYKIQFAGTYSTTN